MTADAGRIDAPRVRSKTEQLVIFDCDGVLVDSERISNRVMCAAIGKLGVAMTDPEVAAAFQGRRLGEMAAEVESRLGSPLPSAWLEDFKAARARAFEAELRPVDGVEKVLRELALAEIPRCVASQAEREKIELTLTLTNLRRFFQSAALFSASMVPRPKPHPDLFLHAAATLGFEPSRCIVVEDGVLGVVAARSAQMRVLGFGDGPSADSLVGAGAEVFSSMADLPRLLWP